MYWGSQSRESLLPNQYSGMTEEFWTMLTCLFYVPWSNTCAWDWRLWSLIHEVYVKRWIIYPYWGMVINPLTPFVRILNMKWRMTTNNSSNELCPWQIWIFRTINDWTLDSLPSLANCPCIFWSSEDLFGELPRSFEEMWVNKLEQEVVKKRWERWLKQKTCCDPNIFLCDVLSVLRFFGKTTTKNNHFQG